MASIVLLLSELLAGGESASVTAADRYMSGQRSLLREFRPAAVTDDDAPPSWPQSERSTGSAAREENQAPKQESFEDLDAVSWIAVDVMWP